MKTVYYALIAALVFSFASCGQLSYKKTPSGLIYKIIPSDSKDSVVKPGQWLKMQYKQTRNNDSVLQSTYGKMPIYQRVQAPAPSIYDPTQLFPLLKKGDSLIIIIMMDSIMKQNPGQELPPFLKNSDRLHMSFKVIDVFDNDSAYFADRDAEMKAYEVIMKKEQEEDAVKQDKEVKDYLAAKKINARRLDKGTYVQILEQGNGPKVDSGKFVTIKYSGRRMVNDSTFESNTYPDLQVGVGAVIDGWDEGLQAFNEGGKGVLYIPAYLAYGKNPRPGPIQPNDALIFDIEILKVADNPGE